MEAALPGAVQDDPSNDGHEALRSPETPAPLDVSPVTQRRRGDTSAKQQHEQAFHEGGLGLAESLEWDFGIVLQDCDADEVKAHRQRVRSDAALSDEQQGHTDARREMARSWKVRPRGAGAGAAGAGAAGAGAAAGGGGLPGWSRRRRFCRRRCCRCRRRRR